MRDVLAELEGTEPSNLITGQRDVIAELEQSGAVKPRVFVKPDKWEGAFDDLLPQKEQDFKKWYGGWASKLGLNPDPDDPQHLYDYRAAFGAGAAPNAEGHWPSQFKLEGHPNLIVNGVDTRTGEPVVKFNPQLEQLSPMQETIAATGAAIPRVLGATAGGLLAMPIAGLAGLAKTITSGIDEGGKTLEQISALPGKLIKTPEQAMAMENIGLVMKPVQMAGEGLQEIVRQTPLKGTIAEPIAGTIGEVSALFGLPGLPKTARRWWYSLPRNQRIAVVEGMKADIANGELTTAQIRELWRDPANRAALLKRYQGVGAEETGRPIRAPFAKPPASGAVLPAGQGFELRPRPSEVRDILSEMGELPPALPPGQGFELQGRAFSPTERALEAEAPLTPALPAPEGIGDQFTFRPAEAEVPVTTKAGTPFTSRKSAEQAMRKAGMDWQLYQVVPAEGGFAISRRIGRTFRTPSEPKPVKPLPPVPRHQKMPEGVVVLQGSPFRVENGAIIAMQEAGLSPEEYRPYQIDDGAWVVRKYDPQKEKLKAEIMPLLAEAIQKKQLEAVAKPPTGEQPLRQAEISGTGATSPPKKGALPPDSIASSLNAEGWVNPSGKEWTDDILIEHLKSGQGRNIFTPEKQDAIIERKLRRQENEWLEGQLADYLESEGIDPGAVRKDQAALQRSLADEARKKGDYPAQAEDAALKELEDFFSGVKEGIPDYPDLAKGGVYRARGLEDAVKLRQQEPEGSLANYDDQSKREWLRGQEPPSDGNLTLYRATPTGEEIKPGDYVTNSLQYAKDHIKNNLRGGGKVTKIEATLDDIYPADGPGEFWYAPKGKVYYSGTYEGKPTGKYLHLTENPEYAENFGKDVRQFTASPERTLDVTAYGEKTVSFESLRKILKKEGIEITESMREKYDDIHKPIWQWIRKYPDMAEGIKTAGYDSIKQVETFTGKGRKETTLVILDKSKVKELPPETAPKAVVAIETGINPEDAVIIYRAHTHDNLDIIKPFTSWAVEEDTAIAYTDNQGFGGQNVRKARVDLSNVLEAGDIHRVDGLTDFAEKLGYEKPAEEAQLWWDAGYRYPWEESRDVKKRLENSGYDWLRYEDDFPAGAETLLALKEKKLILDLPNPSRPPEGTIKTGPIGSERGSLPVPEEIVEALRKSRPVQAIAHLEELGKTIYESGRTKYFDWQAAMKAALGDMWTKFKKYMVDLHARLQSGKIGPLKNQMGAVGKDIYARNRDIKEKGSAGVKSEAKEIIGEIKKMADEYLGSISTRLGNIDPSLKHQLRKMEMTAGIEKSTAIRRVEPMLQKIKLMSREDRLDFDLARKNGDAAKLKEIIDKYNMWKEYAQGTRAVLNELYQKAVSVGFDVGYRKHFHPRIIKDPKGFLEYFYKQKDWPLLERAIKEKEVELNRYLTVEEKANLINSMLRGYGPDTIKLSKPGQLKEREIELVTPELNRFYMDSDGALIKYISTVTDAIEMRRAFGVKAKGAVAPKDTIGHYILNLLVKGKIQPEHEPVLREIYSARFNEVGTRGIVGLYKNLSYIDTMGSPISAITQIGDLAWALYKNGIRRTANAILPALRGKSPITKEDIGIDMIAKEFSDTSKASHAVARIFDATGLTKIDNIGKEALINSTIQKAREMARNQKAELKKELLPIFEGETDALIKDLAEGRISENVKLYAFNTLADFQPIALSEMPQKYLTGGNGRLFYMLKSFTLKQFDVYRREVFQQIAHEGTRLKGLKNLARLTAAFVAANASADIIKAIILNRDIDIEDLAVDNLLRLFGISKFVTWKAREEGAGSAMVRQIAPPFKAADALTKDILQAGDEKGLETAQSIPLVGKLYYWWFGKGVTKTEARKKRETRPAGLNKLKGLD